MSSVKKPSKLYIAVGRLDNETAYSVIIVDSRLAVIDMWSDYIGRASELEAYLIGLINGLRRAFELKYTSLEVFVSSNEVVDILNNKCKSVSSNLRDLCMEVIKFVKKFGKVDVRYIEIEENNRAFSLACKALDIKGRYPPIL